MDAMYKSLRARDIERIFLLDTNMDPKVKGVLKELAEQQYQLQKQVAECVSLLNMMLPIVEGFNMVAEGMKNKLDHLTRNVSENDK